MKAYQVIGNNRRTGTPIRVSIYANSKEDAEGQFSFRYAGVGYVLSDGQIEENHQPKQNQTNHTELPFIRVRARTRK